MINEIETGEPAEGEELLILVPTRSYTVQYGDSTDRIALRFGIPKSDILMLNPWIENELKPGQKIALKYDERRGGMAVANGYFYKGCQAEKLRRALPYLTYVSFASARADEKGIKKSFDDKEGVQSVLAAGKIPLVRVHDYYTQRYKSGEKSVFFIKLIYI